MAIKIQCPFCGKAARVRTSERPTLLTLKAQVFCSSCGQLKAHFIGELTNIQRSIFVDCPEASLWSEPESEQKKKQKPQIDH